MIIWLASYPKSGNTLLRSILSSYFYSKEGDFSFKNLNHISQFPLTSQFMSVGINIDNDEEVFKNFINVQNFLNQEKGKVKFLKTHSALCKMHGSNFTDLNNTLGVIYIVRDPRNVVNSLAHHNDLSIDEAADTMIDNSKFLEKKKHEKNRKNQNRPKTQICRGFYRAPNFRSPGIFELLYKQTHIRASWLRFGPR